MSARLATFVIVSILVFQVNIDQYLTLSPSTFRKSTESCPHGLRKRHVLPCWFYYIISANRQFVDQRLGELKQRKLQLDTRLEELDRLSLSRDEINSIVSDLMKFMADLESIFLDGLPHEKLVALRQCIEKISVDKPADKITLAIYLVPAGSLQATGESTVSI